jgi:hypothetical protein
MGKGKRSFKRFDEKILGARENRFRSAFGSEKSYAHPHCLRPKQGGGHPEAAASRLELDHAQGVNC